MVRGTIKKLSLTDLTEVKLSFLPNFTNYIAFSCMAINVNRSVNQLIISTYIFLHEIDLICVGCIIPIFVQAVSDSIMDGGLHICAVDVSQSRSHNHSYQDH